MTKEQYANPGNQSGHESQRRHVTSRSVGNIALSGEDLEKWKSKRMLFVSGPHGSGKTSIVRTVLAEDFKIFDLGPMVRELHAKLGDGDIDATSHEWVTESDSKKGPNYISSLLVDKIRSLTDPEQPSQGTVMVGSRSLLGIEYYRNTLQPVVSRIVYVDAPFEVLLERYKTRENMPDLSAEAFERLLQQDNLMGLGEVRNHADHLLDNSGDPETAQIYLAEIVSTWHS